MSETPDRGSVMAVLRANRARLMQDKTTTLKVPGYDSLYARYRRLPWEKIEPLIGIREGGDHIEQIGAAMEALIAACVEFLFRTADGELEGLGVRYEQGLAQIIGAEEATAPAEVIDAVFIEEMDLMAHAGEYMVWAMRMEDQVTQELGKAFAETS